MQLRGMEEKVKKYDVYFGEDYNLDDHTPEIEQLRKEMENKKHD